MVVYRSIYPVIVDSALPRSSQDVLLTSVRENILECDKRRSFLFLLFLVEKHNPA